MAIGSERAETRKHHKPLLHNEVIWCKALSEPNDVATGRRADARGRVTSEDYILNEPDRSDVTACTRQG